jgi:DNA-3-methyladenine glycosylase II
MAVLRMPEPYDFAVSTERFRRFGPDRANLWHEGGLHRVVGGREVRIEPAHGGVAVSSLEPDAEGVVRKLLGCEFELEPFYEWAAGDPVLARLTVALRGFRPPLAPDPFESLVTSITAQQVSLQSAVAIRNRLVERYGERGERAVGFPVAERVARAEPADLVALGFSRRKAEYVVSLARSDLRLDELAALPDDEVKARLVVQRGLGDWTADWFLARHLARPQAWPAGDLGLRKAALHFYGVDAETLGSRLAPFQNLAAHYLLTGMRVAP